MCSYPSSRVFLLRCWFNIWHTAKQCPLQYNSLLSRSPLVLGTRQCMTWVWIFGALVSCLFLLCWYVWSPLYLVSFVVFAALAVVATALAQIFTNTYQKSLDCNALQLLYHTSPYIALVRIQFVASTLTSLWPLTRQYNRECWSCALCSMTSMPCPTTHTLGLPCSELVS